MTKFLTLIAVLFAFSSTAFAVEGGLFNITGKGFLPKIKIQKDRGSQIAANQTAVFYAMATLPQSVPTECKPRVKTVTRAARKFNKMPDEDIFKMRALKAIEQLRVCTGMWVVKNFYPPKKLAQY